MTVDLPNAVKGQRVVDGEQIETLSQEIVSANIITVEVGTTGYRGGDSGHGGRTFIRIKDDASTDMRCKVNGYDQDEHRYKDVEFSDAYCIELVFGGDCELDTVIAGLEFAADTLRKQTGGTYTMTAKEKQKDAFWWYLDEVIMLYRKTGKLAGMSAIQKKHHVSAITQAQFFECGLNEAAKANKMIDRDFSDKVYEYVLNKAKGIPAPKYKAE